MGIGAILGVLGAAGNTVKKKYEEAEKKKSSGSSSSSGSSKSSGTPTMITRPDGTKSSGYISNGQTYYNDGKRIGNGDSVTDTSGRIWVMQNGKGVYSGNVKDGLGEAEKKKSSGGSSSSSSSKSSGTPTMITRPDGTKLSGYISNGQTYYDNGKRIENGDSVTDTSGRIWVMQNGEGVYSGNVKDGLGGTAAHLGSTGGKSSIESYYESQLEQAKRDEKRAAEAQAEAQRKQIAANQEAINKNYEQAAREAYIASMQTQKAIPEVMAGKGMLGGATESNLLSAQTAYQNNLSDLDAARLSALSAQDLASRDVSSELASALAGINSNYADRYFNYMQSQEDEAQRRLAESKTDYIDTIGQYYDDYQAEINRLLAQGVSENDYRIQYLRAARQQKILDLEEEKKKTKKRSFNSMIGSVANENVAVSGKPTDAQVKVYNNLLRVSINDKVTPEAYADTIANYYNSGQITYEQAQDLLGRYGLL